MDKGQEITLYGLATAALAFASRLLWVFFRLGKGDPMRQDIAALRVAIEKNSEITSRNSEITAKMHADFLDFLDAEYPRWRINLARRRVGLPIEHPSDGD